MLAMGLFEVSVTDLARGEETLLWDLARALELQKTEQAKATARLLGLECFLPVQLSVRAKPSLFVIQWLRGLHHWPLQRSMLEEQL